MHTSARSDSASASTAERQSAVGPQQRAAFLPATTDRPLAWQGPQELQRLDLVEQVGVGQHGSLRPAGWARL